MQTRVRCPLRAGEIDGRLTPLSFAWAGAHRLPLPRYALLVRLSLWDWSLLRNRNSDFIERHNTANDGSTYTLGHNEFSHLTWEEFRSTVRERALLRVKQNRACLWGKRLMKSW